MTKPKANETLAQALQVLMNRPEDRPKPRARRMPSPLIAELCSCGAVMNGEHWGDCPNGRLTSAQASIKSRRKAQESGWVRMEVLLSPAQSRKLDLLAEIHGSRRKAMVHLIDQS